MTIQSVIGAEIARRVAESPVVNKIEYLLDNLHFADLPIIPETNIVSNCSGTVAFLFEMGEKADSLWHRIIDANKFRLPVNQYVAVPSDRPGYIGSMIMELVLRRYFIEIPKEAAKHSIVKLNRDRFYHYGTYLGSMEIDNREIHLQFHQAGRGEKFGYQAFEADKMRDEQGIPLEMSFHKLKERPN